MVDFIGLEKEQKEKVLRELTRLRSDEQKEVLTQALVDENPDIVEQAIDWVESTNNSALYSNLMWIVREPKSKFRSAVISCLMALPEESFRKVITQEMGSVVFSVRYFALELLAERGDLRDFRNLLPLLFDYKIDVRIKARLALNRIIGRELKRHESRRSSGVALLESQKRDLEYAATWLFRLVDGPDQITAEAAANILIDFGNLEPEGFWKGYSRLKLRSREVLVRLFLRREDATVLRLLICGLLYQERMAADKCVWLLNRLLLKTGPAPILELLQGFSESIQVQLARRMAQSDLLGDLVHRFEMTPEHLKGVLFDFLEQVDYRMYVDFLEGCLKRENPLTVYRALRLLIPLDHRNYVEDFLPLLECGDPEVLLLVLEYLCQRADISIFPKISPLLTHSDERIVRQTVEAVFSLSRHHLLDRYKDLSAAARQEIVKLLHRMDESFVEALCEDISKLSSLEKIHLVNILEILGQESKIQATLLKLSKEPDQRVRATVAKAIQVFSLARQKIELTRTFMEDEDTRVRANVVESLDSIDDDEILKRLIQLTRSPNSRERANAIKKLWELGYRDFEISLVQMSEESDEWTRASAVWVLGEIEAPHLNDVLTNKLNDPSAVVRENAIRALGKQGSNEQIQGLIRYLEDEDRRVREAARDVMRQRLRLSYEIH